MSSRPRDGDFAILKWFTQHLKCTSVKLRQLIEKEYPIMAETDLTRARVTAAAVNMNISCDYVLFTGELYATSYIIA